MVKLVKPVSVREKRVCKACAEEKPSDQFYLVKRDGRTYFQGECKTCRSAKVQEAKRQAIRDPVEAERRRLWRRDRKQKLRRANGCRLRADISNESAQRKAQATEAKAARALAMQHTAHIIRWRAVLKARARYHRSMRSPTYRLNQRMSTAMKKAIRYAKHGRRWERLVGYTLSDLITHIERQFDRGMSWGNFGAWHLDHIIPRSRFSFDTEQDQSFRDCWALMNLRPLWSQLNLAKGAKWLVLL